MHVSLPPRRIGLACRSLPEAGRHQTARLWAICGGGNRAENPIAAVLDPAFRIGGLQLSATKAQADGAQILEKL